MHHGRNIFLAGLVCLLASCGSETPKARPIGEAFVGPASLPLRTGLSTRSQTVAVLKHGERLEVLQVRRRFLKVRNMGGTEGWLDGRNLLSSRQMEGIQQTRSRAGAMPSQGRATVYDALNVHTEPNRQSPSPFQIPPGGSVEVLARLVAPRVPYHSALAGIVPPPRPRARKSKSAKGKAAKSSSSEQKPEFEPPPMPPAPKLPEDWREMSRSELPDNNPSVKMDDWTLVRLPDRKAGWVLTRMLVMAIPDEVAHYAEGKRITSYFPLGEVVDEGVKKNHWLWTTLSHSLENYDFDSFRVFIYNVRRHRYETAYIEREVKGYYPVLLKTVQVTEGRKTLDLPGFTLVTENDEAQRFRRTFVFQGYRVRMVQKEAVEKEPGRLNDFSAPSPSPPSPPPEASLWSRIRLLLTRR
ncbi:MAG: SH3 domain-containing protein [Bryobacterales bacterium]|nr:SH3 domain-containing protein [Bryobacterales bacterium]